MSESVVVTGAAGFIGSHLCERLLDEGFSVLGVDSITDYYSPARKRGNIDALRLRPGFRFAEKDLASAAIDRLLEGSSGVFHLAAQAGVRSSWGRDFRPYLESNVLATQRLLEAMKERPGMRLVHASSSSVYGDAKELPTREDAEKTPRSPYGATKLAAESLLELYRLGFGVEYRALRFFTVYGPRQRPDMAFSRFIEAGIAGAPIEVYGDGTQTRDFTYVADVVEAVLLAYRYEGTERVFNIGGGNRVSLADAIDAIASGLNARLDVRRSESAIGDVADTFADTSRARRELGFAPRVALAEGIRREIEWYRERVTGIEGRPSTP